jgi:hypothetical protein
MSVLAAAAAAVAVPQPVDLCLALSQLLLYVVLLLQQVLHVLAQIWGRMLHGHFRQTTICFSAHPLNALI